MCDFASCADVPDGLGCIYTGTDGEANRFGNYDEEFGHVLCETYSGTPCGENVIEVEDGSGCRNLFATNYDATATTDGEDQFGNSVCEYLNADGTANCDIIPDSRGCVYSNGYATYHGSFEELDCTNYGGTPCTLPTAGCLDENASNYDADAATQLLDDYGNVLCTYASCDDVPADGCLYSNAFGTFNDVFTAWNCEDQGQGIICEEEVPSEGPTSQSINLPGGWSMFSSYLVSESMDM
jgi:hypothetical protein